MDRLLEILSTMDVPDKRKDDFRWLLRNLFIRNASHPNFEEAIELIKEQIYSNFNKEYKKLCEKYIMNGDYFEKNPIINSK